MPAPAKVEKVKELTERLKDVEAAVFADFRGLTVQDAGDLRTALAENDTQFAVVKNTLAKLAVREAKLDALEAFIEGPTAIAFVKGDPVAAAKALVDAAKKFPVLEVRGGFSEGRILSGEEIKTLAALESREVMLAKIAGLAKAQMSRAAYLLQALQAKLISVLEAYKEKLPAEEPAAEASPEAEAPAEEAPTEAEETAETTEETSETKEEE